RPQLFSCENVDGGVDLAESALHVVRIGILDDRLEATPRSAGDAPICAWVVRFERQQGGGRAGRAMLVDQPSQKLGADPWMVARDDDDSARITDVRPCSTQRVARAQRPLLHGDGNSLELA